MDEEPRFVRSKIISASRRTDIPAFFMDWAVERMRGGYVDTVNPFYRNQRFRVSLSPDDVEAFVWWSKDFGLWIKTYKRNQDLFDSYRVHYFHFTINSRSPLEPGLRTSLDERLNQFAALVDFFGPAAVNWRFDPIVFWEDQNGRVHNNLQDFDYILQRIAKLGVEHMTFSFVAFYNRVAKRMKNRGFIPHKLSEDRKISVLEHLAQMCADVGIRMRGCSQPQSLYSVPNVEPGRCIDAEILESLGARHLSHSRDGGQRDLCLCHKSRDIGDYSRAFRCPHRCAYCYAQKTLK